MASEIRYACQFCRVLEPELHKPDCEILTLRAEVERLRKENEAQRDTFYGRAPLDAATEKARADRLAEALREIDKDDAIHIDPATNRYRCDGYSPCQCASRIAAAALKREEKP